MKKSLNVDVLHPEALAVYTSAFSFAFVAGYKPEGTYEDTVALAEECETIASIACIRFGELTGKGMCR